MSIFYSCKGSPSCNVTVQHQLSTERSRSCSLSCAVFSQSHSNHSRSEQHVLWRDAFSHRFAIDRTMFETAMPIYSPSRIDNGTLVLKLEHGIVVTDDVRSRRCFSGCSRVFERNLHCSPSCNEHSGRIAGRHCFQIMKCDKLSCGHCVVPISHLANTRRMRH